MHSLTIPPVKPNIQYLIPYQRSVPAPYPLRPRKSAWSASSHLQSRYIPHQQPIPFSAGHRTHRPSQPLDPMALLGTQPISDRRILHPRPSRPCTLSHKPSHRDVPSSHDASLALPTLGSYHRRLLPIIIALTLLRSPYLKLLPPLLRCSRWYVLIVPPWRPSWKVIITHDIQSFIYSAVRLACRCLGMRFVMRF